MLAKSLGATKQDGTPLPKMPRGEGLLAAAFLVVEGSDGLTRYEKHLESQFYRTLRELERIQAARSTLDAHGDENSGRQHREPVRRLHE